MLIGAMTPGNSTMLRTGMTISASAGMRTVSFGALEMMVSLSGGMSGLLTQIFSGAAQRIH
jgi:hypothetical protein